MKEQKIACSHRWKARPRMAMVQWHRIVRLHVLYRWAARTIADTLPLPRRQVALCLARYHLPQGLRLRSHPAVRADGLPRRILCDNSFFPHLLQARGAAVDASEETDEGGEV